MNARSTTTILLCLAAAIAFCAPSAPAQDKDKDKKPQAKPLYDKRYKIFSPDGENELGTYTIRANEDRETKQFEILAAATLDYQGKKIDLKSSVTYGAEKPFAPRKAKAKTLVNGKVCMQGSLALSKASADIECTGFLNKRSEEKIDPPKVYSKKGEPIPEGPTIFQSALILIGPKLLPKVGELKDIVWVEFPDDIGAPELVNFKEGYRLVRDAPDEDGEFELLVYSADNNDEPVSTVRFSKKGEIVELDTLGGLKLVEDKG